MGNLIRVLSRLCEALLPHLRAGRVAYVVGGVAPAAARASMWLVNDLQEVNVMGVERMVGQGEERDLPTPPQLTRELQVRHGGNRRHLLGS